MATNPTQIVSNNPTGSLFNRAFLEGATERSLKTGAQALASVIGVDATLGATAQINVLELDWVTLLGIFLGGVLSSVITSIINPQFVAGTQLQTIVPTGAEVGPVGVPTRESITEAQKALAGTEPAAVGSTVTPTGQVPTV